MIKTVFDRTREDGVNLYCTYSNKNMMIQKDGTDKIYSEAIDVENSGYTYSETNIPIEGDTDDDTEQKAAAFDYLTGRADDE